MYDRVCDRDGDGVCVLVRVRMIMGTLTLFESCTASVPQLARSFTEMEIMSSGSVGLRTTLYHSVARAALMLVREPLKRISGTFVHPPFCRVRPVWVTIVSRPWLVILRSTLSSGVGPQPLYGYVKSGSLTLK